jgi:hypothetical protein
LPAEKKIFGGKIMKRTVLSVACGAALLTFGAGAQAATNFELDVNAAIDAGLAYSRATNAFTVYTEANGLTLLTLLEKEHVAPIPPGYAGLSVSDQTLARQSACLLMTNGNFGGRAGFYSYYDGQVMMALSTYALTGGPDAPAECAAQSVRATMDKVVDRSIAAQTKTGGCAGMWGYTGNGCDSSTTQFTGSGLASAKGYYISLGDPGARAGKIQTALNLTSNAYATNGKTNAGGLFTDCPTAPAPDLALGCLSHAYTTGTAGPSSSQQTASGTWLQLLGTGKNIDTPTIQGYLRYLQNAYSYLTNNYYESWPPAYFYFLWSSSKAYNLMEDAAPPSAGKIGPADIGTLPGLTAGWTRQVNRNPATDPRVPKWGAGAGYYAGYPAGWYYDYAYRLMGLQLADGRFNNPNGTWNSQVDHAYALLVLQRAVGFEPTPKCDADGDSFITKADLAIISKARGQAATGPNDPRDSDNDGKITILDVKKCVPLVVSVSPS